MRRSSDTTWETRRRISRAIDEDDAWGVPKSVVTTSHFDWENDRPPLTPLHDSILYELHVKGFTRAASRDSGRIARHLRRPRLIRSSIEYLKKLGITAVELMPVHEFVDDKHLLDQGLRNYWGYNSINFFSPDARYSASGDRGEQIGEFKAMVKALHRAGIEVILDVVYNHTAEGNQMGPTLSFRGIDNPTYYRLVHDNPRYYMDYTGTGNTLNVRHPQVLKLIMDSLRYWVQEMHVDGFRFDLAAALARELHDVDRLSAFFDIINQDPVISQVKLIAEPWDVGEGGYQVGKFPPLWAEWNGQYRDAVRRYWKGDDGQLAELGYRLTGSSDLYQRDGRHPTASINFVTAHDGFTLQRSGELTTTNTTKPTAKKIATAPTTIIPRTTARKARLTIPRFWKLRERQKRNFLLTLLLSQGVPMICGGDEIGRTQHGNNNAYAQDNEVSWYRLESGRAQAVALLEFTRRLVEMRRQHPNLHRRKFFQDRGIDPGHSGARGRRPARTGHHLAASRRRGNDAEEWNQGWVRCIGLQLNGRTLDDVNGVGETDSRRDVS